MAKKSGYKRKRSPSPNQSTSDSPKVDQSFQNGSRPLVVVAHHDEDALIEVVMNMLPFEVCAML